MVDCPQKFNATNPDDVVESCRSCGAKDLYRQKDFPRKIAFPIVVIAAILVPWTYGLSLIAAAAIDFFLYRRTAWMAVCYECHAEYRGFRMNSGHKDFDRHLDELYRYGGR